MHVLFWITVSTLHLSNGHMNYETRVGSQAGWASKKTCDEAASELERRSNGKTTAWCKKQ